MSADKIKKIFFSKTKQVAFFVSVLFFCFLASNVQNVQAAATKTINYQGKLTDLSDVAVPNGAYDVVFKLYKTAGGGSADWTESWTSASLWTETGNTTVAAGTGGNGCSTATTKISYSTETNESSLSAGQTLWDTTNGDNAVIESINTGSNYVCVYTPTATWSNNDDLTNRVYVKNGIFSISLGTLTAIGVDFGSSDYYLGVKVEGDNEMTPRKKMNSTPQSFNATNLISSGIINIDNTDPAQAAADINYNPTSGTNSALNIIYGSGGGTGTALNVLQSGTGYAALFNGGNVGIGTTNPGAYNLNVNGSIIASIYYSSDGTAGATATTGGLVFKNGLYVSGTISAMPTGTNGQTLYNSSGTWTVTSNLYNNGTNVGVGTTNPLALFSVGNNSPFQVSSTGMIGLGGTTPLFSLGVDSTDSNKFKIYAGSDITGTSQFTIDSNGVTSIANLDMGEMNFSPDSGAISWIDMQVTNASPANMVESYTAKLDNNPMITVYGTSDGAGGVSNLGVGIGTLTPAGLFDVNGKLTVLSGGNVGIGTTNPATLLHVSGGVNLPTIGANTRAIFGGGNSSNSQISIIAGNAQISGILFGDTDLEYVGRINYSHATNKLSIYTNNSENLVIDSSGNVGIGTTAPGAKLEVSNGTQYTQFEGNQISFSRNDGPSYIRSLNSGGYLAFVTNGTSPSLSNSNLVLKTDQSSYFNGNVGIGTTGPSSRLQIGDLTANTANQIILGKYEASSQNNLPIIQQKSIITAGTGNDLALGTQSTDGGIVFYTGVSGTQNMLGSGSNAIRMIIDKTGSVGIGTTAPGAKLHSYISLAGTYAGYFQQDSASSGHGVLIETDGNGSGSNALYVRTAVSTAPIDAFIIKGNGNIGIGTTNPGMSLEIAGTLSGSPTYMFEGVRISAGGHSGGIGVDGAGANWGTAFFQDGTKRMVLDSTGGLLIGSSYISANAPSNGLLVEGNVGIGTTSPASIFQVHAGVDQNVRMGSIYSHPYIATYNDANSAFVPMELFASEYHLNSGNVGIGTTSPNEKLTISGAYSTSQNYGLSINDGQSGAGKYELGLKLKSDAGGNYRGGIDIISNTASLEAITIMPNGVKIGIGTTAPATSLQVVGTEMHPHITIGPSSQSSGNAGIYLSGRSSGVENQSEIYADYNGGLHYAANNNANGIQAFNTGGLERMRITYNGNVGIGTTDPGYHLSVGSNSGNEYIQILGGASSSTGLLFSTAKSTNAGAIFYDAGVNKMSFRTNGDTANKELVIDSSGNIGISTTNPQYKLDVQGTGTQAYFGNGIYSGAGSAGAIQIGDSILSKAYGSNWILSAFQPDSDNSRVMGVATARYAKIWTLGVDSYNSPFTIYMNGDPKVTVLTNGNLGIGTTNPLALFSVGSSSQFQVNASGQITSGTWNGSLITPQYGGTGINGATAPNGSLLIGNGSGYTLATLTAGTGIGITNNAGQIVINSTSTGIGHSAASLSGSYDYLTINTATQVITLGAIDLTTDVTGILPLANGGTGTGTTFPQGSVVFAGASGVYTSDNANFFYSSTNHRLGLGTTNPTEMLEIYGTGNKIKLAYNATTYTTLSSTSNGELAIYGSGTGGSLMMIGSGAAEDTGIIYDGSANDYYFGLDDTDNMIKLGLGQAIGTNPFMAIGSTGNIGLGGTAANYVNILANGNVGIGTTSPGYKLHVVGTSGPFGVFERNSTSNGANFISLYNTNTTDNNAAFLTFEGDTTGAGATTLADYARIGAVYTVHDDATYSGSLVFRTSYNGTESEKMRISGNGNVGIGTTNPAFKLDVAGTLRIQAASNGILRFSDSVDSLINAQYNAYTHQFLNGNSEWMRITNAGKIGIGTTSPNNLLSIVGSSAKALEIKNSSDAVAGTVLGSLYFTGGSPSYDDATESANPGAKIVALGSGTWGNYLPTDLAFYTTSASSATAGERLRITSSGYVGIGTTNPTYQLQTTGSLGIGGTAYFASNVGIGTATPAYNLQIKGASNVSQSFFKIQDSDNINQFIVESSSGGDVYASLYETSGTRNILLNTNGSSYLNGGSIGIGTTNPQDKLHIYESTGGVGGYQMILQSRDNGYGAGVSFQSNLSGGSLAEMARITADGESSWNTTASTQDAGLRFYTSLDGTVSEKVRISASGYVGIGTTNPTSLLAISGSGTTEAINFYGDNNVAANPDIKFASAGMIAAESSIYLNLDSDNNSTGSALIVMNNAATSSGTELFRIQENGYVGIGTTNPTALLTLVGSNISRASLNIASGVAPSSPNDGDFWYDGTHLYFQNVATSKDLLAGGGADNLGNHIMTANLQTKGYWISNDGDNEGLWVKSDGNVGIGTTNPVQALDINGSLAFGGVTRITSGGGFFRGPNGTAAVPAYSFGNDADTGLYWPAVANNLGFTVGGSEVLRINSSGYVGIGTTNPGYNLDVNGTFGISGNAYFDSSVGVGIAPSSAIRMYIYNAETNPTHTTGFESANYPTLSSDSTTSYYGSIIYNRPIINTGVTHSTGAIYGNYTLGLRNYNGASADDGGTLATLYGQRIGYGNYNTNSATTPQTTNAYGLYVQPYFMTGTIDKMIDIYLSGGSTGGTVNNHWGIYQAGSSVPNFFAGNVGIGTTNPSASLDIAGSALIESANSLMFRSANNTISSPVANVLAISTNAIERIRIDSSGYVGIGTTNPITRLQIGDATADAANYMQFGKRVATSETNLPFVGFDSYNGTANDLGLGSKSGTGGINFYAGNTATTFNAAFIKMRLDSAGNLGIGTTVPTALLTLAASNTTRASLNIASGAAPSSPNDGDFWYDGTHLYFRNSTTNKDLLAGGGGASIGGAIGSGTSGSVLFVNSSSQLAQDNANFFWNAGSATLGIGTTASNAKLNILSTTEQMRLGYDSTKYAKFTVGSDSKMSVETSAGTQSMITIGKGQAQDAGVSFDGNANDYYVGMDDTTDKFMIGLGLSVGTTPYVTMDASGNVGVGTTAPAYRLDVGGGAIGNDIRGYDVYTHDGGVTSFSDARLKNITGSYNRGLNEIMALDTVYYNFRSDNSLGLDPNSQNIGLVAQDVQKIIPEAVSQNSRGYLTLTNTPIFYAMLNAIQEQQNHIDNQDMVNGGQDKLIVDLKNQLDDENITVKDKLTMIGVSISNIVDRVTTDETQIADQQAQINSQNDAIKKLEDQMALLQQQNQAVIDFISVLDPKSLIYKDAEGNLDLGLGKLKAEGVVAGIFTVKVDDQNNRTIGNAVITSVVVDADRDGMDDNTGSDGKSVIVRTSAASDVSRIFISPKAKEALKYPLTITEIKNGEYFKVEFPEAVKNDLSFDWWIVGESEGGAGAQPTIE